MMVTFISQCEKKALNRSRRVLDAFANRIGDNTWQTVITEEGLLAVKKLLRKTASKNTAVACHWLRSRSRSELVWVVGNKDKFNSQGIVPVNSTKTNHSYRDDLADWHYLPVIQSLASLAALLHDWGKASARFQEKLSKDYQGKYGDALRHEWVSCVLLKALISSTGVNTDEGWLKLLASGEINEQTLLRTNLQAIEKPLTGLPPAAKLVAWLILTHHRLPLRKGKPSQLLDNCKPAETIDQLLAQLDAEWGYRNEFDGWREQVKDCLSFPKGLLDNAQPWLKELKRWANKLNGQQTLIEKTMNDGSYRLILHHARLSLMLGDHFYSSLTLEDSGPWKNTTGMIANTQKDGSAKQALDQHLVGVYQQAKRNVRKLPQLEQALPDTTNTAALKKKSPATYAWQDRAVSKIRQWRCQQNDQRQGFFAVNMASTGCGKTYANAKVMMALSEHNDILRYILALGLRTLTLQTGDEYRERIFQHSDGSDLAVLIGSKAIVELHEQDKQQAVQKRILASCSESQETLLADNDAIDFDGDLPEQGMDTLLTNHKDRQFLYAPILTCTIDHMMAATETTRGGRYILPCLRLMSSDLVIDEVDDFTGSDAIAIGRLIHLAGMLGRKVMISSATIPPDLAEGYFNCYREGWQLFAKTRNASQRIGCAWIDEFSTQVTDNVSQQAAEQYHREHTDFIEKRVGHLCKQAAKRKANIVDCQPVLDETSQTDTPTKQQAWFETIRREALQKHSAHQQTDSKTGLAVSFGVIRIANIPPCIALTRYLLDCDWPDDTEIRVLPYHSQQVLLLRHTQEQHLDDVLKRKEQPGAEPKAFANNLIRQHLDGIANAIQPITNVIFMLVATPVEEVGRDHDFDWAIVEPSSYRSIIQLAGRVRRHRDSEVSQPNIGLLQYNWRTIRDGETSDKARFCRPGFESDSPLSHGRPPHFKTHNLAELLDLQKIAERLDAIPRIQCDDSTPLFALLEHAVITDQLNSPTNKGPHTLQGYLTQAWFLTALPQALNRFRQSEASILLYRGPGDGNEIIFWQRNEQGELLCDNNANEPLNQASVHRIEAVTLSTEQRNRLWLVRNYDDLLTQQAELRDINLQTAALRYGELNLREQQSGDLFYNDQLGLFTEERR
ncbi:MAG: type I-F CRISPR-associated helicase Cas3f [Pseudomonadales bacterium]